MAAEDYIGYTFVDVATDFTGLAVSYAQHITGCDTVTLQPAATRDPNGKLEYGDAFAFDITRLRKLDIPRVELTAPLGDSEDKAGADPRASSARRATSATRAPSTRSATTSRSTAGAGATRGAAARSGRSR